VAFVFATTENIQVASREPPQAEVVPLDERVFDKQINSLHGNGYGKEILDNQSVFEIVSTNKQKNFASRSWVAICFMK
jgi:hypothetical protein